MEFVPEDVRSTAMGIHQTDGIGMFAGPWIGGILADYTDIRVMLASPACLGPISLSVSIRTSLQNKRSVKNMIYDTSVQHYAVALT